VSTARVHALIPAAGRGTRYGGAVLKQYLPVCGKTVLAHAIAALQSHPLVSGITVILAVDDQQFDKAVGPLSRVVGTVTGGATRAQSVRNGLQFVVDKHPETNWVLIHDAARPCLPPAALDRLLQHGLQCPHGAILAIPVGDTLKRANDAQEVVATVDRRGLWAAQTPQLFHLRTLLDAMNAALEAGHELTDEASAMEFAGLRPKLIMGSAANIKITHSSDLAIAEAWFQLVGPAC